MNRRAFVLAALALSGCASGGVRVIAPPNSALSELDETTAKPLLPEFGRALRVAKTLVEQEMETIMDG